MTANYESVLSYNNPNVIQRYSDKLKFSTEESTRLFKDVKTFLYCCANSDKNLSPTLLLDEGWHDFILYTKDYDLFCKKYFNKFIHHQPFSNNQQAAPNWYETLIESAKKLGCDTSSKYWTKSEYTDCDGEGEGGTTNCQDAKCSLLG